MIAARHSQVANDKLGKECEIETDKHDQCGELSEFFRVQSSGNLWPPIMQSSHESSDHAPDHNVMKMGDYKIRIGDMHIEREGGQEKTGQSTDSEKSDKSQGV